MSKRIEYDKSDSWSRWSIGITSSSEGNHSTFYLALGRHSWYIKVPPIVKPKEKWVDLSKQDWATVNLDGSKGYTDRIKRDYGITISDEYIHVHYGIQPGNWTSGDPKNSDHTKLFEIPWRMTRRVRYSFYRPDGTLFTNVYDIGKRSRGCDFDAIREAETAVPKSKFKFKDYDGIDNLATCYLNEMEWKYGLGLWKWIGYFRNPIICRSLNIEFEKETGRGKSDWKGGTMGTSTDIKIGQSALSAFTKYGTEEINGKYHGVVNRGFTDIMEVYEL